MGGDDRGSAISSLVCLATVRPLVRDNRRTFVGKRWQREVLLLRHYVCHAAVSETGRQEEWWAGRIRWQNLFLVFIRILIARSKEKNFLKEKIIQRTEKAVRDLTSQNAMDLSCNSVYMMLSVSSQLNNFKYQVKIRAR